MMKKRTVHFFCLILTLCLILPLVGCRKDIEEIDLTKTNINVEVFNGGYGYAWLKSAATRFEEEYKDYKNGDKTGVKILIRPTTNTGRNIYEKIAVAENDVYFSEQVDNYYDFVNSDYLLDLTDVLSENIESQNHSVLDTMSDDIKQYYGVEKDGAKKYFGVPFSQSLLSMMYDSQLFYNRGFYLMREYDTVGNEGAVDNFVIKRVRDSDANAAGEYSVLVEEDGKKYFKTTVGDYLSKGPDGEYGTHDDGMPATYAEFFQLCAYMNGDGVKPFNYSGKSAPSYVRWFLAQLSTDYEGYDQALLNYNFNGVKKDLISVNNETVIALPNVTLTPDNSAKNAIEVNKAAARYNALDFLQKMVRNDSEYLGDDAKGNADIFRAQESFMLSKRDVKKSAFHIDGIWWENEASATFEKLAKSIDPSYAKKNRHFKMMPLPKATKAKVGNGATYVDTGYQVSFVLKQTDQSKQYIAKQFLQYCFTDKSHAEYTLSVGGVPRPFDYKLTTEQYNSMTTYSKSVWDTLKVNTRVVMPVSSSPYYLKKQTNLNPAWMFYTFIDGYEYTNILEVIRVKKLSAETAFNGIYEYAKRTEGK